MTAVSFTCSFLIEAVSQTDTKGKRPGECPGLLPRQMPLYQGSLAEARQPFAVMRKAVGLQGECVSLLCKVYTKNR